VAGLGHGLGKASQRFRRDKAVGANFSAGFADQEFGKQLARGSRDRTYRNGGGKWMPRWALFR